METFLLASENTVRIGVLLLMLAAMSLWEVLAPRRLPVASDDRWPTMRRISNLAVMVAGAMAVRMVFPVLGSAMAVIAQRQGWGVFNLIGSPLWIAVLVCFMALDALIYFQHRLFHAVPILWRLHRMHHADTQIDTTTGVRFHPMEIILSMAIKLAGVIVLGAPVVAVILFETVLNATSLFNHANIALPERADRWMRHIVVTPDMHRVHHSWHTDETNANFGFNLPWWDWLFGTYTAQPRDGHDSMMIGLTTFRARSEARIDRLLIHPFVGDRS